MSEENILVSTSEFKNTDADADTTYALNAKEYITFLENKLDQDIGFYYWKRYIAAAFWAQISTPINLVITLLTALTTAQATASDILPHSIYSQISIVSLVITTLNTFFRPHVQLNANNELMKKWVELGIEFENLYYDDLEDPKENTKELDKRIKRYKNLQDKINDQRKSEGPGTINFTTDFIHLICMATCISQYKRWLDHDKKILKEAEKRDRKEKILKQHDEMMYRIQKQELEKTEKNIKKEISEERPKEIKITI
jgi:hypothetical protein